jgi:energy-coupling factor transporter ATP-binding protein EcfA2
VTEPANPDRFAVDSDCADGQHLSAGGKRRRKNGEEEAGDHPRGQRRADVMLNEVLVEAEIWHGQDRTPYATVQIREHRENLPITGGRFEDWLHWRAHCGGEPLLNASEVEKVKAGLAALALVDGQAYQTWIRVAQHDDTIVVDLGDESRRCVQIFPARADSDERWRLLEEAPQGVKFVRPPGMKQMATPTVGGTSSDLRRWLNVESEAHFQLAVLWIISSYRPRGPFFVGAVSGPQGSGKSTLTRTLSRLVDPQEAAERSPPREPRDLWVATKGARLLSFDNLSGISSELSDAFCRLSTGAAFATRKMYSDTDEVVIKACAPVLLNAIVDVIRRPDLADRSLQISSRRLTANNRKTEQQYWQEFDEEEGLLLGVIFDGVSAALAGYAETPVPDVRMADAARFGIAGCTFYNWEPATIATLLRQNRAAANLSVLESNAFAGVLIEFLERQGGEWRGPMKELLTKLEDVAPDRVRRSKSWPATPNAGRAVVDRLKDALESLGFEFDFGRAGGGQRYIHFKRFVKDVVD